MKPKDSPNAGTVYFLAIMTRETLEELTKGPEPEVLYDRMNQEKGSQVGYSRAYAENWEKVFGKRNDRGDN